MAKIDRYDGNVKAFAVDNQTGEKYLFGSSTTDSDSLTDQLTSEFLRGWATVGASEFPPLEWFNAAMFTSTQFISYLHQMGVPEWNSEQEYPTIGSSCIHLGITWFRSESWSLGDEPGYSNSWLPIEAENKAKGNQNWNVLGKDSNPLPTSSPTVYPAGQEVVSGVIAVTECTLTYSGGLISGTGVYRRTVNGEFPNSFFGVKQEFGLISKSGVSLSVSAGSTLVDVDLSLSGPHRFVQISESSGVSPNVSNDESEIAMRGGFILISNSNGEAHIYPNGRVDQFITAPSTANNPGLANVEFNYPVPISSIQQIQHSLKDKNSGTLSGLTTFAPVGLRTSTGATIEVQGSDGNGLITVDIVVRGMI